MFLPEPEYQAIHAWAAAHSPWDVPELERRSQDFDGFRLYDQENRCQFLDEHQACRLHKEGVKPTECFWWPFHVFAAADGALEIRLFQACCDAYKHYVPGLPMLEIIEAQARKIGLATIRSFRQVYPGTDTLPVVKQIRE